MTIFARWLASISYFFDAITFSSLTDHALIKQQPLFENLGLHDQGYGYGDPPVFAPPSGPKHFKCNYTAMGTDWKPCSTSQSRACWLRASDGREYNIKTDYEANTPIGVTRHYVLNASELTLSPDGFKNTGGKVFNETYPGPWLQACWGDTIEVKVINNLRHNGTTIHWHGIRQFGTLDMDGVNGVTQCPIAPGDSFTYKFKATQYGTSWYHSHYSLQYADGLLGPLTIYGPSSENYDIAEDPILVTDWLHRSAFEEFYKEIVGTTGPPKMVSMLMNGRGNYTCTPQEIANKNCTTVPEKHETKVKEGKKYLLRLINTSVDTQWIFSIDNHTLSVIASDFVSIHPYETDHIVIGIGQRYHVTVQATRPLSDANYWMRMTPAAGCSGFSADYRPETRMGILRYDNDDRHDPTTSAQGYSLNCRDEKYENLVPIIPWTVGPPSDEQQHNTFEVGLSPSGPRPPWQGNVSRWELGNAPLWLNFSDPTIINVGTGKKWDTDPTLTNLVVVNEKEVTTAGSWIYLLITATNYPFGTPNRQFITASHPIHLHGHDFAILRQSDTPYWDGIVDMKFDNPPRRDVALLHQGGYLILAFKADNPGSWLIHCHIAWHASSGLALQIMEREASINATLTDERRAETRRVCDNWNTWFGNPKNHWNPKDPNAFQDDSGI